MEILWLDEPSVTKVPGFLATGVACGIKKSNDLDLALILSEGACVAAGVFTLNRVQAAPVRVSKERIKSGGEFRAIVINSGIANACTGLQGDIDAVSMVTTVESVLGLPTGSALVMSTGIIGHYLPMEKIIQGIKKAAGSLASHNDNLAQRAIMTTDTRPKAAAVHCEIQGRKITIAGICKGSGMIHPHMGTMLAVLATDVAITHEMAQCALQWVVDRSFNMVTVDGDTSTNDSVFLLANGVAKNPSFERNSEDFLHFRAALSRVATSLTEQIARDGEGASKFIVVKVKGARDFFSASQVAKSIASSNLVKTAIYGEDANWGRILCAAGYSGADIEQERLSLWLASSAGSIQLVKEGLPFEENASVSKKILQQTDIVVTMDLGQGESEANSWTCDFTHKYIDINAHYHT
ncbi:MAG: bifunctional glutamate N-acetyltransferase/amino-acid acetyltransferase ArgJ [bacterium]